MPQKPSILIITFCIPWPVADGGKMYVYTSVNYLRSHYDITLLVSVYSQVDVDNVATLQKMWPDVRVELVNYLKQKSFKDQIKRKALHLITTVFAKKQPKNQSDVFFDIRKKITNIFLLSNTLLQKCEQLFASSTYDIVQAEYSTNLCTVNFIPAGTLKVYVEIESLYSIMNDYIAVSGTNTFTNRYLINTAMHIELDLMNRYDAILALNENDNQRLGALLPGKPISTSPFAVPNSSFGLPKQMAYWKPEKLIFLGSESHYPNKDAVEWYVNSIMPLVTKKDIQLYITGNWSDEFKSRLSHFTNITFTGFVDDIGKVMKNSILLIPMRLGGGGIRAKLIEALAFGIPVVTTSLGCMGLGLTDGTDLFIKDDAKTFARAIDELFTNVKTGKYMLVASNVKAQNQFSEQAAGEVRHRFYQELLNSKK